LFPTWQYSICLRVHAVAIVLGIGTLYALRLPDIPELLVEIAHFFEQVVQF
jgi:hypothetical protein